MPLINFKTDLTTLKYGLDQPGGGYSGLPFVQFPIDNANTAPAIKRYYELNRTSLDFPIRGGSGELLETGIVTPISSTVDRELIQKFIESSPRGKAFVDKQKGLVLTNPRTQVQNTVTFPSLAIGNAVIPITQTYNELNTLAQVQIQGTGGHFNYYGTNPQIIQGFRSTYEFIAGAPQNNTPTTNRLLILKTLKLDLTERFAPTLNEIINAGVDNTTIERLGISPISNQLFNYQGGPGSVYGIGNTRIFRVTNTEPQTDPVTQQSYSTISLTYNQLAGQKTYDFLPTVGRVQDFRSQTNEGEPTIPFSNYEVNNIARPYDGKGGLGIGNPGGPLPNNTTNYESKPGGADLLNLLSPFYYQAYGAGGQNPWDAGGNDTKDIIKFMFECMSNDTPNNAVAIPFRAFLEGSIEDNNQAQYNNFKYLGRGETFRTYQGFDRTISFSFKVFAQSRLEMAPLYTKVNMLMSQVYPDYNNTTGLMRGSVVRLTIGDYLYRVPGFLENVDVSIDNSSTSWEIVLSPEDEEDVAQLPHYVTISCTFKPIMNFLPSRVTNTNVNVPLIGNIDGNTFLNKIVDTTTKAVIQNNQNTGGNAGASNTPDGAATVDPSAVPGFTAGQQPGANSSGVESPLQNNKRRYIRAQKKIAKEFEKRALGNSKNLRRSQQAGQDDVLSGLGDIRQIIFGG